VTRLIASLFAILLLLPSAYAQTAKFPGAIAADKDLTVQKDKAQSTITGAMTSSATSATVVTGSKFIAGMIVSVENEQMLVCSVVSNTVNFGYSACPNIDGRGYAGTSAASHANGSLISGNVVAWNHNSLKEEVKAIETALGVNLGNIATIPDPLTVAKGGTGVQTLTGIPVASGTTALSGVAAASELQYLRRKPNAGASVTYEFAAGPRMESADYDFPAQTPGGTLTATVGATVTMTPCPLGVAGTHTVAGNLPHLLYITGGSGTAEAVAITGGTCTSGASTGTITFTPANNHSGAWTIKSNTTGAQEAIYAAGATGRVQLACSTLDLWGNTASVAALTVPDGYSTSVRGCGMRNTKLLTHFTTGDVFRYEFVSAGGNVDTGDYQILDDGDTTHTTGVALRIRYRSDGNVSNILTSSMYDSVWLEGCNRVTFAEATIYSYHNGITVTCDGVAGASCSSQLRILHPHVITMVAGGHGIHIQDQTTGIEIINPEIEGGLSPVGASNIALYAKVTSAGSLNEIKVIGGYLDSHTTCAYVEGNGATYDNNSFQILTSHIACSNYGVQATGYVQDLLVSGNLISAVGSGSPGNAGAVSIGANTRNMRVVANEMNTDGQACFYISGATSKLDALSNTCGLETQPANAINISAAVTGARFKGNTFSTSSTVYTASPAPTSLVMQGNTGIDDVVTTVASAATYAFPINPHVLISGSTNVTGVTHPLAAGATGTIRATAANITFTVGASIGASFILKQGAVANWLWDGTLLWLSGQDPSLSNTRNYIATESGSNNAIAGTLTGVTLAAGLTVTVQLAHTLQAGANTFNLNGGGAVNIKSSRNVANNIAVAYAATGTITLMYDGTQWVDVSQ
jgi:hypothetical protein